MARAYKFLFVWLTLLVLGVSLWHSIWASENDAELVQAPGAAGPQFLPLIRQLGVQSTPTSIPIPTVSPEIFRIDEVETGSGSRSDLGFVTISCVGYSGGFVFLTDWQLVNITTKAGYTLPYSGLQCLDQYNARAYLTIFAGEGTQDNNSFNGRLYWGLDYRPWSIGDQIELRDANGRVMSSFTV